MRPRKLSPRLLPSKQVVVTQLTVFILTLSLLLTLDYFFTVKKINISSSKQETVKGLENYRYKNLIFLQKKDIENNLLSLNPTIKTLDIEKIYPDRLDIRLDFYEPQAALLVNQGVFFISSDGVILHKLKENKLNLPLINYYQKLDYTSYSPGDKISYKDILTSLDFLRKTQELGLTVITIDISGDNMIALNLGKSKIFFTSGRSADIQSYELGIIIRQFKIEGKSFSSLDFRFDRPVIKF